MPNPVAANDLQPISGSLQTSRISYGVETAGKNYGQNYNSTTWYSDIPNNGQFYTIISDNYTANYYVSRSNAGGAYVEGGLPAVDEYSAPVFWVTVGTSSLDITTVVNGLPDRIGQTPFVSGAEALNWVASSSNYFAVGPDYYEQVDADQLRLYLNASQVISYPTTQSTWYDLSGYFNNGTLINGPTFDSSLGTIYLDGVDDYVTCDLDTTEAAIFNDQDITFEMLCNTTTNNNAYHTLMAVFDPNHGSGNDASITLGQWRNGLQNGSFYWQIATSVQSYLIDSSTTYTSADIATGKFFHVVGTWGKNGSVYRGILYVNGSQVSAANSAITTYTASDATKIYIGNDIYVAYRQGNINNAKIYSKALSAAEVAQNYYGGPIVTDGLVFAVDAGNLVSYPKSGTTLYNLTGSVNGTLTNGPTFSPVDGGVLVFDGTDDYINFGNPGSLFNPATSTMTMMGWIYVKSNQTNILIGLQESGAGSLSLGTNSSGNVRFICRPTAGSQGTIDSSATLSLNTWYHIAVTKDTTNSISNCTLWINGSPVNTASSGVNFPTSTSDIRSAVYLDSLTYSNINIGSIQVYNRALTAAEVLQNYNATK